MKNSDLSANPDQTDDCVYQDEFVNWVEKIAFPNHNTPIFYSLDNEPGLWYSSNSNYPGTHQRIHPYPLTYSEIITRTTEYAKAIKSISPNSKVFGAVCYGWYEFVTLQDAPDGNGRDYLDFYLDSMRLFQETDATEQRLVDVLDLHWYPEALADGSRITGLRGPNLNAKQIEGIVQAPRSYWDPSYMENSWNYH